MVYRFCGRVVCLRNKLSTPLSRISKWASTSLLTTEGYVVVRQLTRSETERPSNLQSWAVDYLPSLELFVLRMYLCVVLELVGLFFAEDLLVF